MQRPPASVPLARQAREQFVIHAEGMLVALSEGIRARLNELADSGAGARERQARRDAVLEFERVRGGWINDTRKAWRNAVVPPAIAARVRKEGAVLELIGDEVVEQKILSSRLALAVLEKATWEINDLKLRIQHLDGTEELAPEDVLRPEVTAQLLVEQWAASGLSRETWVLVQDILQKHMVERMVSGYKLANEFLVQRGVMPDIDLSARVKRGAASRGTESGHASIAGPVSTGAGTISGSSHGGQSGRGGPSAPPSGSPGRGGPQQAGAAGASVPGSIPASARGSSGSGRGSGPGSVADETRLMTASTPLARARMRASGVLGQLKRLLTDRVAGFDPEHETRPSPALAAAIASDAGHVQTRFEQHGAEGDETIPSVIVYDNAAVERVATDLRQRTGALKKKAATSTEKATIEIVALMFQSILSEDRIPPAVRVWFARLQMPVLRVALAEPEFFGSLEHPARQLIDRMGSCVMGFDASAIGGGALETEIKRVVQVIEQYPETGRRVFQLVYDEFQKFLSRFLTEKGTTQRLVSVAQQVEQKETMAIQYTIEMRKMLDDIPVRDEIREFLFKVWAEVLAVAAVKHGPQHNETIALKKSAAELVWAASAKPNRSDRARVIQDLPQLLQRLRRGMSLMGIQGAAQEAHIKVIGDTLADAFLSKTEAIPQARIEALAKRLAHLEDYVADDPATDLPLDAESIELMLGIDASMIEVVSDGGSKPSDAMLAWAQELQLGTWFTLDHNGKTSHVQYAWRSDRKQLHLFAMPDGKSFLVQARRLAAYLQAGLLLPTEEEALTVRATRDALAKLDANPERLLS